MLFVYYPVLFFLLQSLYSPLHLWGLVLIRFLLPLGQHILSFPSHSLALITAASVSPTSVNFSFSLSLNSLFCLPLSHSTLPKSFVIFPHSKPPLPLTPASSLPLQSSPCSSFLICLGYKPSRPTPSPMVCPGTIKCCPILFLYSSVCHCSLQSVCHLICE